jgi:hypothetical protein
MSRDLQRHPDEILTARKSIRKNCIACMGGSPSEVADCTSYGCYLWPWRNGTPPERKRKHRGSQVFKKREVEEEVPTFRIRR